MIDISLKKISKSYGVDTILKDVTYTINENEKVGLVGINGAGKTTLFKILCGTLAPDSGDIFIQPGKRLGYLSQNLELDDDSTIFEETMKVFDDIKDIEIRMHELEIELSSSDEDEDNHKKLLNEYGHLQEEFERKNGYGCESFARGILVGLGISPDDFSKQVRYLSGGQKTRVALSKLLLKNPEVLLLDEPTNHLDLDAISFLENFLKDYKGTVIIISHDRYFLDVITTKTLELTFGVIDEYNGNYSYFISERQKRYEEKMKDFELQQREIKRQEEIIERFRSYNREKSIKQAESREKALSKVERIDKPKVENYTTKISFDIKFKSGNDVLIAEDLSKSYGDNLLFKDLSFMIRRGERVALIGQNGKGKTTLFKIITGEVTADTGTARLGRNVYVGYYDQEQKNLSQGKTVLEEIWDEYPDMTVTEIRNCLGAFLFRGDDAFKEISLLSGGEKCRLSLLKLMLSRDNFLLLDEPTNHLDILSREALEDALLDYDGTIFVISHDRYFLNKVIGRMFELEDGGFTEYPGNFQYYLSKKSSPEDEIVVNTSGKTKTEIKEERRKLREIQDRKKQLQRDISEVEKNIGIMEENIKNFEEMMCLEEVYSNPEKSLEVSKKLRESKEALNNLYSKWEELILLNEE